MGITVAKATRAMKWSRLDFSGVSDGRKARGKRHGHAGLLRQAVAAMAAGMRSLRQFEAFGEGLTGRALRAFGLKRAPSDTCMYGMLSKQAPSGLDQVLVQQVKDAIEQKVISNDLFDTGVIAIDGKSIWSGPCEAVPQARKTPGENGLPTWFVMAQRACLVSSSARPVVHQKLMNANEGEATTFRETFRWLLENFGKSFEFVTYDAGGVSRENALVVHEAERAYWFAIKGSQPSVHMAARTRLGSKEDMGDSSREGSVRVEERSQGRDVVREAFCVAVTERDPELEFPGAKQLWRIRMTSTQRDDAGKLVDRHVEDRYFITNRVLSPKNGLRLARLHWGIENGPNWTMDVILGEDDGSVCTKGVAVEVWSWLRLMAYNLISFWRRHLLPRHGDAVSWLDTLNHLRDSFVSLVDGPRLMPV
jgi:hypothetical protein